MPSTSEGGLERQYRRAKLRVNRFIEGSASHVHGSEVLTVVASHGVST